MEGSPASSIGEDAVAENDAHAAGKKNNDDDDDHEDEVDDDQLFERYKTSAMEYMELGDWTEALEYLTDAINMCYPSGAHVSLENHHGFGKKKRPWRQVSTRISIYCLRVLPVGTMPRNF